MNELHRVLLGTLLNSLWQIPLLYSASWLTSKFWRRTNPAQQHRLWVMTLYACVILPVLGALGWFRAAIERYVAHSYAASTVPDDLLATVSGLPNAATSPGSHLSAFSLGNLLLALWSCWIIFRSVRLFWSLKIVRDLAKGAVPCRSLLCSMPQENAAGLHGSNVVAPILVSDRLTTPATAGVLNPVVLVPRSLADGASDNDLQAMIAHELAHVARRDFFHNLLQEIVSLPISFHPVFQTVRSRVADSRELVCDEIAARRTGSAPRYAASLLHLATILSNPDPTPTPALGLFEGQNLEHRIMSLLNQAPHSSRTRTAFLTIATLAVFAPCCFTAAAFSVQPAAVAAADLQPYSGAWHWMFKGKPFVTMQLIPTGDHFTGFLTNGSFANDKDGTMTDAKSLPGKSPIMRSFFSGNVLHIIVEDGHDKSTSEWTMTLLDANRAEFNTADPEAPKNLKPWIAVRSAE